MFEILDRRTSLTGNHIKILTAAICRRRGGSLALTFGEHRMDTRIASSADLRSTRP